MNDRDRTVSGVEDANGLLSLRDAVAELVAREDQRREDKVRDDALRATLRTSDEKRWDGMDARLDRVQVDVVNLRQDMAKLPSMLEVGLRETALKAAEEARRTAHEVRLETERTATELAAKAEETAADLKAATALVASVKREREEKAAVAGFLSFSVRVLLTVAIVVAVGIAALIVFTDQDSTAQSIAVVAAVVAPSVAGLGLLWYHGRSNH